MVLKDIDKFEFKRINPFQGLIIDVDIWRDAHDYHRNQQRLHNLALHRPGIVSGLGVVANQPPDLSVKIQPGIGIDPEGNVIVVSKSQNYRLQSREKGIIYLIIQFREIPTGPNQPPEGGQPTRILEAYRIQERDSLPKESYLELARIDFDPGKPITDAKTPSQPGKSEIDLRFRQETIAQAKCQLILGHVSLAEDKQLHRAGLANLVREINRGTDYEATINEAISLAETIKDCNLLYVTGKGRFELDAETQENLAKFLQRGGRIVGEGCAQGTGGTMQAREFGIAFSHLAQQLGYRLEKISYGHPLLISHYVFATVPPGAIPEGVILTGGPIICSANDYGCAWQGGYPENPLSRDTIRGAFEMGINISVYGE